MFPIGLLMGIDQSTNVRPRLSCTPLPAYDAYPSSLLTPPHTPPLRYRYHYLYYICTHHHSLPSLFRTASYRPNRSGLYFWQRGVPLHRPLQSPQYGVDHSYRLHHVGVCDVCCGCGVCCGIEESRLPMYKLLASSLLVAGGLEQVSSPCCLSVLSVFIGYWLL